MKYPFILCAVLIVLLIIAASCSRERPQPAGRYQLIPGPNTPGLLDTATGRIYYATNQTWALLIDGPATTSTQTKQTP